MSTLNLKEIKERQVSKRTAEQTCKKGKGEITCQFLQYCFDTQRYYCSKNSILEENVKSKIDEGKQIAIGDHCPGWPNITIPPKGEGPIALIGTA